MIAGTPRVATLTPAARGHAGPPGPPKMNKSLLLLAALAFIGLSGCTSDDDTVVEGEGDDTTMVMEPAPMPEPMPADTMMAPADTMMAPAAGDSAAAPAGE